MIERFSRLLARKDQISTPQGFEEFKPNSLGLKGYVSKRGSPLINVQVSSLFRKGAVETPFMIDTGSAIAVLNSEDAEKIWTASRRRRW